MIVCDTNVLVFDVLRDKRLSATARRALDRGEASGDLACSDVSLWEIACLIANRRVRMDTDARTAIAHILAYRELRVLPIDADIAIAASGLLAGKTDPFDRIIAATAIAHNAPLISADERLHDIPGLKIIW